MSRQTVVNESVQVSARMLPSGKIVLKSFDWQGVTHYVFAHGRQWEEESGGKRLRCFLVQTGDLNSYELRWDPVEDEWRLYRAWIANFV